MAQERSAFGDVYITHVALSAALGVRRSGISVVLAGNEEARLIILHRGRIVVRDRAGLEELLINFERNESALPNSGKIIENHA